MKSDIQIAKEAKLIKAKEVVAAFDDFENDFLNDLVVHRQGV